MNNVVTKYTLHGKNIVHMTQGSNELHFFYDAYNKPAVVVYNGTPYSYVKNLQGDIVAILNSAGTAVVNYAYDAWGRPISKTGSMAGTLGTVQPFRYRGYVYDEETGLYYLRSRYYNPAKCRFLNGDVIILGNSFAYCFSSPVGMTDSTGKAPEGEFDLTKTTYYLASDQLSAEDAYFNEYYLMRIAMFLFDATDYYYHHNLFCEAEFDVCGFGPITKGYSDCSHLMAHISGYGSNTAPYRYSEFKGTKGKLLNADGQLAVELKQGMEVFKRSGDSDQGHVGMLMLYDFGNGLEWAVFQSASMEITKSDAVFLGDVEGGPNITALFNKNGVCTWKYYIDPYSIE